MEVIHNTLYSSSNAGEERSADYLEDKMDIELELIAKTTSHQDNVETILVAVGQTKKLYLFCWLLTSLHS